MARKYSRSAGKDVKREMHKFKQGKLKSGRSGKNREKPQAGDRDRPLGSPQEGEEGSPEKIMAAAGAVSGRLSLAQNP